MHKRKYDEISEEKKIIKKAQLPQKTWIIDTTQKCSGKYSRFTGFVVEMGDPVYVKSVEGQLPPLLWNYTLKNNAINRLTERYFNISTRDQNVLAKYQTEFDDESMIKARKTQEIPAWMTRIDNILWKSNPQILKTSNVIKKDPNKVIRVYRGLQNPMIPYGVDVLESCALSSTSLDICTAVHFMFSTGGIADVLENTIRDFFVPKTMAIDYMMKNPSIRSKADVIQIYKHWKDNLTTDNLDSIFYTRSYYENPVEDTIFQTVEGNTFIEHMAENMYDYLSPLNSQQLYYLKNVSGKNIRVKFSVEDFLFYYQAVFGRPFSSAVLLIIDILDDVVPCVYLGETNAVESFQKEVLLPTGTQLKVDCETLIELPTLESDYFYVDGTVSARAILCTAYNVKKCKKAKKDKKN